MKLIGLLLLLSTIQAIEKPSWCSGTKLYVEKRICINPTLFNLEDKLLQAYRNARDSRNNSQQIRLKKEQRAWIKKRNRNCDGRADSCIMGYYDNRIKDLSIKTSRQSPSEISNSSNLPFVGTKHNKDKEYFVKINNNGNVLVTSMYKGKKSTIIKQKYKKMMHSQYSAEFIYITKNKICIEYNISYFCEKLYW